MRKANRVIGGLLLSVIMLSSSVFVSTIVIANDVENINAVKTKASSLVVDDTSVELEKAISFKANTSTSSKSSRLADGVYTVDVTTNSPMFKILEKDKNKCYLIVVDGEMFAKFNLNGVSYKYLFMGTAEEAEKAEAADYIKYKSKQIPDPDLGSYEVYNYTIPVSNLNMEMDVAAFSTKSGKWFDRKMKFSNLYNEQMEISKVKDSEVKSLKAKALKGKITLSWKKNSNFSKYVVYSSTKALSGFKKVGTVNTNTLTIKKGLKKGKYYYYKVVGYKGINGERVYGKYSSTIQVKAK